LLLMGFNSSLPQLVWDLKALFLLLLKDKRLLKQHTESQIPNVQYLVTRITHFYTGEHRARTSLQ